MLRSGAGVHEGLGDNRQARVHYVRLVDVENKIWILNQIDPKSERQAIRFPSVNNLWIGNSYGSVSVSVCFIIIMPERERTSLQQLLRSVPFIPCRSSMGRENDKVGASIYIIS